MSSSSDSDRSELLGRGGGKKKGFLAKCCCGSVYCGCVVFIAIILFISHIAAGQFIKINESQVMGSCDTDPKTSTNTIWWPDCAQPVLKATMAAFNLNHTSQLVKFLSRPAPDGATTVELTGWFLPGDRTHLPLGAKPPRIVIQHGYTSNANKVRVQAAAYLLRAMGFDVFTPNLRDHCSSAKTGDVNKWGWAYPFDLLGAWDYAMSDPQGIMGGPIPASQVGLMGFSMGGFTTATAFGMEPNAPGAWLDGMVMSPRRGLKAGLTKETGSVLTWFLLEPTWAWTKSIADVDIMLNTPTSTLPLGPETNRPVAVAYDLQDATVWADNSQDLVKLLAEYPGKYDLRETFATDNACPSDPHCMIHVARPNEYRERLCRFWSDVFDRNVTHCGLDGMPSWGGRRLQEVDVVSLAV